MARLGGMSSESFSSPSSGLGSILRDQKLMAGASSSRANVILGIARPHTPHSVSLASSPIESSFLDADITADDSDEFKEEDVWAVDTRSWHQDVSKPSEGETYWQPGVEDLGLGLRFGKSKMKAAEDVGLGFGKQRMNAADELGLGTGTKERVNRGMEDLGLGLGKHAVEVVRSSRRREKGPGITDAFVNAGAVGLSPLSRMSESSSSGLGRMPSRRSTASRMIPQLGGAGKDSSSRHAERQSAPVKVPDWSKIMAEVKCKKMGIMDDDDGDDKDKDDDDDDDDRLPPHELLAREYARSQRTTFSVCEGLGRTLKGRDLSRVRNAVWSKMGFAD